jgi:hypothetical protein
MSALFEDGSGHGTAIAEVLASNPKAASQEETGNTETIEGLGEYTYYGEPEEDETGEEASEDTEESDTDEVSMLDLLDSGYEWTEGVNPNIELYSGKVLDSNNETTTERLIEGIEWAIETDADILSLSIGTEKDSKKLHQAIQKAAAQGMLIIAAAGDDEKTDYPAAYPEVMSVGMVNSMGESDGVPSEVAAPGDGIISRGIFDSMQVFSGSSMAVPHVVGLASILWQKDTSKDADFIRGLIDVSANRLENQDSCQYGLIDVSYAIESYQAFAKEVQENGQILKNISKGTNTDYVQEEVNDKIENLSEVVTDDEMELLHGNWEWADHKLLISRENKGAWKNLGRYLEIIRIGISFVDLKDKNPKCYGMHDHPWLHGFCGGYQKQGSSEKSTKSNYMTAFRTLVEMAEEMRSSGKLKSISTKNVSEKEVKNALKGIQKTFDEEKDTIGSQTWGEIDKCFAKKGNSVPKVYRSLLLYGMAIHTLTDTFSHSSFGAETGKKKSGSKVIWKRYTHSGKKSDAKYADNTENKKLRYESAKAAAQKALDNIKVTKKKGLTKYANTDKTAQCFIADKQFETLQSYFQKYTDAKAKKRIIIRRRYLKDAYAIKDFATYYKQEKSVANNTVEAFEKYTKVMDVETAKKRVKFFYVFKLKSNRIKGLEANGTLKIKDGKKTIMTQKLSGNQADVILEKDVDYTIESTTSEGTFTVCTVENGVVYDSIRRKMTLQSTEEVELDENEELELCDDTTYEVSENCMVQGKVNCFDMTTDGSYQSLYFPLQGVNVSMVSRTDGTVYQTETEEDGSYAIEVPHDTYDVTYDKGKGYNSARQLLTPKGDLYSNNLSVTLVSEKWFGEGLLYGYLCDKDTNLPVSGAQIQGYKEIEYYESEPVVSVYSDANGFFNTGLLPAGSYTYVITKDGYQKFYLYDVIFGNIGSYASVLPLEKEVQEG